MGMHDYLCLYAYIKLNYVDLQSDLVKMVEARDNTDWYLIRIFPFCYVHLDFFGH